MRGIYWSLLLVCCVMFAGMGSVYAETAAADPDTVQIVALEGGGYVITSPDYQARIGSDGNLHSFSVNGEGNDKYRSFEREVIGGIQREADSRKGKLEAARVSREKKAKRKRQRAAAAV